MLTFVQVRQDRGRAENDAVHGVFRHDELGADPPRQFTIQLVEQRAASREIDAALEDIGGYFGRKFLDAALQEIG